MASKWGFTDKNYTQLQKLHEKYAEEKGLRILGFPCNQFGSQVSKLVHRFNTIEAEIVTEIKGIWELILNIVKGIPAEFGRSFLSPY